MLLTSKSDPYGFLTLSKCQESLLGKWQRPREFMSNPVLFDDTDAGMYLVQDIITDCSVVASLCSAAAYEYKHHSKVHPSPPPPTYPNISPFHLFAPSRCI